MDSYINDESRPVLGLGFKDSLGGLLTSFKPTQTKLTPFFSNLLPEETMRNYGWACWCEPSTGVFLLWVLGQDLAGAITVEPADGEALPPNVHQGIDDETKLKRRCASHWRVCSWSFQPCNRLTAAWPFQQLVKVALGLWSCRHLDLTLCQKMNIRWWNWLACWGWMCQKRSYSRLTRLLIFQQALANMVTVRLWSSALIVLMAKRYTLRILRKCLASILKINTKSQYAQYCSGYRHWR